MMATAVQDPPVIEFDGVSFSYGTVPVLDSVHLRVPALDFLCVVGPNAGGKTTLLRLILGLVRPHSGTVRVFGGTPAKARRRIGYMPQHAALDPLFPASVLDVALMGRLGRRHWGFYSRADRRAADEALARVDLLSVRDRPLASLSGGQRQRVLMARALVTQPELLLLDEPTANVDAVVGTELQELLRQLNEHMTVVLVTHDLGFVAAYVKRVACVNRRVVVHATADVSGAMISELYHCDVHMVRHDTVQPQDNGHG